MPESNPTPEDKRISELPIATDAPDSTWLVCVINGTTVRIQKSTLLRVP